MNKTEQDYSIEYGKTLERIRILDLLSDSQIINSDQSFLLRQLIKEIEDTHPETDWGRREGRES